MLRLFLFVIAPLFVSGQQLKLSDYLKDTHSKALYEFMESEVDTLIIDKKQDPWIFGPMTFSNVKNKVILFEFGVEVLAKKNAFPKKTDALWKFLDCKNIEIRGNHSILKMNKEEYVDGEWRHVIRLRGCENISIYDLTLRDSGGDGISIGRSRDAKFWFSKNIRLENIQCINNKRQGISITSAEDVWVSNSCFADTVGTLPGAGVDIEPNVKEERIVNVNFKNCVFKNNFNAGIKISLAKLTSESEKVSITFENCTLSNNFSVHNTKIPAEIFINSHRTDPASGSIFFSNCLIENSNWPMLYSRNNAKGFQVTFENCIAKNICLLNGCNAAINLRVGASKGLSTYGGYDFKNLELVYNRKVPAILIVGSRGNLRNKLKNVTGGILIRNSNSEFKTAIYYDKYDPRHNENVSVSIK